MPLLAAKILVGFVVGLLIGMSGVGGGVLLLPVLIFGLRIPPIVAVGSDALFQFFTKIPAGLLHLRNGTVRRKVVLALALGSIPGSFAGVKLLMYIRLLYGNGVSVLHKHDGLAGYIERDIRGVNGGGGALVQVVAVHGGVQDADRHGLVPDAGQDFPEPEREMVAQGRDADQHYIRALLIALRNLVRDAGERALDGDGIEDDDGFRHKKSRTCSAGRNRFAWLASCSYFLRRLAGPR